MSTLSLGLAGLGLDLSQGVWVGPGVTLVRVHVLLEDSNAPPRPVSRPLASLGVEWLYA